MEPDLLDSSTGSFFACSDFQLTATHQTDVASVEVAAVQQKVVEKIKNKVDTTAIQEDIPLSAALSVKSQVKVRYIFRMISWHDPSST